MRRAILIVAIALPGLAACGKMSSLEPPPGSTYPKTYPAAASAPAQKPVTDVTKQPQGAFTASGAWIDPDTRQPQIDPRADQDAWSAINKPGTY